mgnify:CR=1 FL=1
MCSINKKEKFTFNYNKYRNLVINHIQKKTNNLDIAEDMCQEVFMRYYLKIDSVKTNSIKSWLLKTSNFILLNYYRHLNTISRFNYTIQENTTYEDKRQTIAQWDTKILLEDALAMFYQENNNHDDKVFYDFLVFKEESFSTIAIKTTYSEAQVSYKYKRIKQWFYHYFLNIGIKSSYQIYV